MPIYTYDEFGFFLEEVLLTIDIYGGNVCLYGVYCVMIVPLIALYRFLAKMEL